MSIRPIKRIAASKPTMEGAGVKLHRAFGFGTTDEFDPFLLLDDFRNDRPDDYRAGFPWHPHRGIETITYVLAGTVEHGDSLGNQGRMGAGDVQWMTAGRGILHQEMPQGDAQGRMHGFQLWANLPASLKMTAPRYQDIPAKQIPDIVPKLVNAKQTGGRVGAFAKASINTLLGTPDQARRYFQANKLAHALLIPSELWFRALATIGMICSTSYNSPAATRLTVGQTVTAYLRPAFQLNPKP